MMFLSNEWRIKAKTLALIFTYFICIGCFKLPTLDPYLNLSNAPANDSASACINVKGTVLGDIIIGSDVSLHSVSGLNYSVVMVEVNKHGPIHRELINESKAFKVECLDFGNYAFVIPTSSYNGSVGSPLPYEFECLEYMVGAFSIEQPIHKNKTACKKNLFFCLKKRSGLYIKCPLDGR
jgi:hypothetical protein